MGYERRWVQTQVNRENKGKRKEEVKRIRSLVDNAYASDPRIKRFQAEERAKKRSRKNQKETGARTPESRQTSRRTGAARQNQRRRRRKESCRSQNPRRRTEKERSG